MQLEPAETITLKTEKFCLSGDTLVMLLAGYLGAHPTQISANFTVPTGGDYSGMTLDLCADPKLTVDIKFTYET